MMWELGLILAFLVPAGLILGIVVLNRSRARIERDGADYGGFGSSPGGSTWVGTEATSWDNRSDSNWSSGDSSGSWDSGSSNSSCDSGGASDSGGSGDSGGGGSCD